MPIISFCNPKGGSGKTTSALILATCLSDQGASVSVVDADPEQWLCQWKATSKTAITVTGDATEDTILDVVDTEAQRSAFVIVDLEGTSSLLVAQAIAASQLVIIPTQGSSLDAKGAAKAIKLVANQSRVIRRPIASRVLFTRTSAAIESRSLKNIRSQFAEAGVVALMTPLVERAAFRDLLDYGGGLIDLDPAKVANLPKAIANAEAFVAEIISILKESQS